MTKQTAIKLMKRATKHNRKSVIVLSGTHRQIEDNKGIHELFNGNYYFTEWTIIN